MLADLPPILRLLLVGLFLGCSSEPSNDTVEVVGDTTTVVSRGPSAWGDDLIASIDLVIGGADAADEYVFGRLEPMTLTADGGVIVYDQMYNRVSRYAADGSFVGHVGGGGQGPGEYEAVVDLAVSPSGDLVVQLYEGRVLWYDTQGLYKAEWRAGRPLAIGRSLTPLGDSLVALKLSRSLVDFAMYTAAGEMVDSVGLPPTPWDDEVGVGQSSITPSRFDLWSPAGFGLSAIGSRLAFQTVEANGQVLRVERAQRKVSFLDAERGDWEAQNEFLRQRTRDPDRFPPVPEFKPVIRAVFTPRSGEVWVQVATHSIGPDPGHVEIVAGLRATPEWLEPLRMEVFSQTGEYLGSVLGPAGIDVRAIGDGTIWGYRNGEFGEQHIVRLRTDR